MRLKAGIAIKDVYWTIGNYNLATIVEAPDGRPLTTLLLSVGKLGNVRTHTLRAFSASEMQAILGRVQ